MGKSGRGSHYNSVVFSPVFIFDFLSYFSLRDAEVVPSVPLIVHQSNESIVTDINQLI